MTSSVELSNHLQSLNLNCHSLDQSDVLLDIKRNYESIFSWNIYEKTGTRRNKCINILEKVTQKQDIIFEEKNIFNFNKMYLHLISCFELFLNGDFSKALLNIKYLIQTLKSVQMDTFFEPIADACFHIIYSTQAYIMAFSNENVQQILKDIKPLSNFNRIEKSMICAIKSKVFMEYPSGNKEIALEFAESALNLNDTEIYWTSIWLKAKGRKRRSDTKCTFPFRDELEAAKKLSIYEKHPQLLLDASNVFQEAGLALKIKTSPDNKKKSDAYYQLSIDLTLNVYRLAKNDLKLLYNCLEILIYIPNHLLNNNMSILKDIVSKLNQAQNNRIYETLGKYFLKIEKNYRGAQIFFAKSSASGLFLSSLQLLKVECLLKSSDGFPVVQYLNSLYERYEDPKRRLIIISQLLFYYIFNEKNPEQFLYYLNIYLNEDISYRQKKHQINSTFPLFHSKTKFNPRNMLNIVSKEVEKLKFSSSWDSNQKKTLENVITKFTSVCNPPEKDEENYDTNLSCVVCLEMDSACVVLIPCYHRCVCKTCWMKLNKNPICPMCRTVVTSTLIC